MCRDRHIRQDLRSWTIFGGAQHPQKSSNHWVFRGQCVSPVRISRNSFVGQYSPRPTGLTQWDNFGGAQHPQKSSKDWVFPGQRKL